MKQPIFEYKDGHAKCITEDEMGRRFCGEAFCSKEDKDFENEVTGLTIAEYRAQIAAARTYRNDLKIKIAALKQLLYSMNQSGNFNPKSYEAKMLYRQLKLHREDLQIAIHQVAVLKLELNNYINEKEIFYQRARKLRQREKLDKK